MLPRLRAASVHLVLCDPPYGLTDCAWDRRIDASRMWAEWRRVLRPRGAVVVFVQRPYCGEVMGAAPRGWFRYEWVWDKRGASGFLHAKRMPMRAHESVLVFGPRPQYFPQGLRRLARVKARARSQTAVYGGCVSPSVQRWTGYPVSLLRFAREAGARPAQKPVALLEYLIRTYTRRGNVVLDNAMGLGSTGVAAVRAGRRFIGMELDRARFEEAQGRIEAAGRGRASGR